MEAAMFNDPRIKLSIPKKFTAGIRINDGPLAGQLAMPCSCGRPFEPGDEIVVVGTPKGDFFLLHAEHAPTGIGFVGDDDF
jgi:hypothetical protein